MFHSHKLTSTMHMTSRTTILNVAKHDCTIAARKYDLRGEVGRVEVGVSGKHIVKPCSLLSPHALVFTRVYNVNKNEAVGIYMDNILQFLMQASH